FLTCVRKLTKRCPCTRGRKAGQGTLFRQSATNGNRIELHHATCHSDRIVCAGGEPAARDAIALARAPRRSGGRRYERPGANRTIESKSTGPGTPGTGKQFVSGTSCQ